MTSYCHLHAEEPPLVSCTEIAYSICFQLPSIPAGRLLQVHIENESCLVDKGRHLTCQLAIESVSKRQKTHYFHRTGLDVFLNTLTMKRSHKSAIFFLSYNTLILTGDIFITENITLTNDTCFYRV